MSAEIRVKSAVSWFEIPTLKIERAQAFYERVLETKMNEFEDENPMLVFTNRDQAGVGGALVQRDFQQPSDAGTIVYLSCDGDLNVVIERVVAAGGTVLLPKTPVPGGFGHFCCIQDTEGNHVGLHSNI